MGFMDSVSTFTKGVGAKAKGNYDVVALNTQVSACKKEIAALYAKLGETYYNVHRNDPDEVVKSIVDEIIDRENKIAAINDQIVQTKEATAAVQLTNSPVAAGPANTLGRKCVNCGAALADDALFCAECGTKNEIVVAPVSSGRTCSECGAPLEDDAIFCSKCGAKNEIVSEVTEEAAAIETDVLKCSNCGAVLEADSMFCSECGTKVE